MKNIVYILFVMACNAAYASDVIEKWECQENNYGNWTDILVKAQVIKGRTKGIIHVAGVVQDTSFEIKGFNRRWDFGLSIEGTYKFAFVLMPNGKASYYDFSLESHTDPSMILYCRQK